ncbi:MAG: hypothetical protein SCK70_03660 [bacterium]|nr:hypothetical protein [bacterium]
MKKKLIVVLIFFFIITSAHVLAAQQFESKKVEPQKIELQPLKFTLSDSWFGRDKAHHFLTSAFLTTAGYYYCRDVAHWSNQKSQIGGLSFSISLGLLKEFRDGVKPGNAFSWKDLVADALGTAVGLLLVSD